MFVIVKQGVYIQEVYGPYNTEEQAKPFAHKLAREDKDSYHTYDICRITDAGLELYSFSINKENERKLREGEL